MEFWKAFRIFEKPITKIVNGAGFERVCSSQKKGFERAVLTKVPEHSYLLLPNTLSQLKMWALSWLPVRVAQYLIGRQYRKSWQTFSSSARSFFICCDALSPKKKSRDRIFCFGIATKIKTIALK